MEVALPASGLTGPAPPPRARHGGRVLDVVFVAVSVLFFAAGVGYVGACDRLMK